MKVRLLSAVLSVSFLFGALSAQGQQPAGVADAIQNVASNSGTNTTVSFDPALLQAANARFHKSNAVLKSITVENFLSLRNPTRPRWSFYASEQYAALKAAYDAAGYHHVVGQEVDGRAAGIAQHTGMQFWLHSDGANLDKVVVMLTAPEQMQLIELSGKLKAQDLVRLSGHFGIPQIDPRTIIVPAPMAPAVPAQPQMRGQLDIDPGGGGWGGGSGGFPN